MTIKCNILGLINCFVKTPLSRFSNSSKKQSISRVLGRLLKKAKFYVLQMLKKYILTYPKAAKLATLFDIAIDTMLLYDCTILKFVANYIKGRKAYTSFRNHKSIQRQVKTGVPQGGVLSPTLFNIHTADIPTPTAPVQVMLYADDITITSTHTSMSAARKYIQ